MRVQIGIRFPIIVLAVVLIGVIAYLALGNGHGAKRPHGTTALHTSTQTGTSTLSQGSTTRGSTRTNGATTTGLTGTNGSVPTQGSIVTNGSTPTTTVGTRNTPSQARGKGLPPKRVQAVQDKTDSEQIVSVHQRGPGINNVTVVDRKASREAVIQNGLLVNFQTGKVLYSLKGDGSNPNSCYTRTTQGTVLPNPATIATLPPNIPASDYSFSSPHTIAWTQPAVLKGSQVVTGTVTFNSANLIVSATENQGHGLNMTYTISYPSAWPAALKAPSKLCAAS